MINWNTMVKETFELTKELLDEQIDEKYDIDDYVDELYNSELNFNNADTTSHMRCYNREQIFDGVKKILNE